MRMFDSEGQVTDDTNLAVKIEWFVSKFRGGVQNENVIQELY